jgi:hypothetical protein
MAGQLVRLPLGGVAARNIPLTTGDLWIATLLGLTLLALLSGIRAHPTGDLLLLAALTACNIASLCSAAGRFDLTSAQIVTALAYFGRWAAYLALWIIVPTFLHDSYAPKRLFAQVSSGVVLFACLGILQSALLPNFAQRVYPESIPFQDWDIQGRRLVWSFLDPNFAGGLIGIGLLAWISRRLAGSTTPSLIAVVLGVALLLTFSRSSIGAFFITGTFAALLAARQRVRAIGTILVVAFVIGTALYFLRDLASSYQKLSLTDKSALQRLVALSLVLETFKTNPLLGVGYNTFGFVREAYGSPTIGAAAFGAEGGVLFALAVFGLLGTVCFLLVFGTMTYRGIKLWRLATASPDSRALGLCSALSVVFVLIHSFGSNSVFYPPITGTLAMLAGCCSATRLAQASGPQVSSRPSVVA